MREMKDSGTDWIGNVPSNWIRSKIKNVCSTLGSGTTPDSHIMDYYDGEIPWIQSGDIYGKNEIVDTSVNVTELALRALPSLKVYRAPFVTMAMYGGSVGNLAISTIDACSNQACCCMKPRKDVEIGFLYYWLVFCKQDFLVKAEGGGQPNISQNKIKNQIFFLPSYEEQSKIVSFLDAQCAEIDALSADIQSEIDTLQAYKRSVITEAVTKGLDKNVPMKDSGTEWLGNIPKHWEISRIGAVYNLRNTKVSDRDYEPLSVTMKGVVPQLDNAAKTNAHDDRKLVRKGDFVINSRSDRRGSCGISPTDGSVSLINTVLAPKGEMNPEYYDWLFHTVGFADEFYKWGHGIVDDLWTTGWQEMKRILIPFPTLEEQKHIAEYLNDKCSKIDVILTQKQEQLEILADYKKSVIYEYVTGKKEVPV